MQIIWHSLNWVWMKKNWVSSKYTPKHVSHDPEYSSSNHGSLKRSRFCNEVARAEWTRSLMTQSLYPQKHGPIERSLVAGFYETQTFDMQIFFESIFRIKKNLKTTSQIRDTDPLRLKSKDRRYWLLAVRWDIFLNYGSIWWLEKDMHFELFYCYLTKLNLPYVILLELCSLSP